MNCERCNVEMEKKDIFMRLGYDKEARNPFGGYNTKTYFGA